MYSIKKWKDYMKFPSVIAPAIRNRILSLVVILLPVLFLLLNITGVFVWKCPFHQLTGFDCGGCGMTRGVIAAVKGHCGKAFSLHPFSIPLLCLWLFWTVITFFPPSWRRRILDVIEIFEHKTGLFFIMVILFILFGVVRLILEVAQVV